LPDEGDSNRRARPYAAQDPHLRGAAAGALGRTPPETPPLRGQLEDARRIALSREYQLRLYTGRITFAIS
ncbi:MAG: hypothetical protein ACK53Y_04045, partial [bacterium]